MTTNPSAPVGAPHKDVLEAPYPAATILLTVKASAMIAPRTGYVTSAKVVPLAAVTGAASPASRSITLLAPTTRAITDGIIAVANTSAFKGPWSATPGYAVGDVVTYFNGQFVCIATATTEAPTDTTKWQSVHAVGLGYLTSRTAAFTKDDIGKTISGTGFTSAVITDVIDSTTAAVTANSAVRNALSVTIGASRTLATLALLSGVNLVADTASTLTLDTTDTKVYKGDVLQVVSAPVGGTGLVDGGGGTAIIEITSYGEGT